MTDPRSLGGEITIAMPERFELNDNLILAPDADGKGEVVRGPNIKPFPLAVPIEDTVCAKAILTVGDNITTDHIMPAGSKILPFRSNIPYLSQFCFEVCDKQFPERAKENGGGIVVAGENYGQGSSREHAALVPLYLGVRAVIARSFARIHKDNLVNNGIIPLTFKYPADLENISLMDELELPGIKTALLSSDKCTLNNKTTGKSFELSVQLTERQRKILADGGLINHTKRSI